MFQNERDWKERARKRGQKKRKKECALSNLEMFLDVIASAARQSPVTE
jgi:hypothetical protein